MSVGRGRRAAWQVDAFVADDQATVGKIEDGHAFCRWPIVPSPRLQDKAHLTHTEVLAVRCPFETKELLIAAAPDIFFDDDHYRGDRAVLVRLPVVAPDELDSLLRRACDFQAARQKAQALKIISADAMHYRAPGRPTLHEYHEGAPAMTDLSRTPVTLIGASRGLGRVLAETFHRLGAQVLVVARGQAGLDAVARDLPGWRCWRATRRRPMRRTACSPSRRRAS